MKAAFLQNFNMHTRATARVLYVPTSETYRAAEALREYAALNSVEYREWDCIHGWRELKQGHAAPTTGDGNVDFFQAACQIDDVLAGYRNRWQDGIFVMHYPHWALRGEQSLHTLVQIIKQYSRTFASTKQRLALLVPAGFTPPVEVSHEVAVCELALPCRDELREVLVTMIEGTQKASLVSWFSSEDNLATIINAGMGMTESEFRRAVGRALVLNKDTWPNTAFQDFLKVVMDAKVEAVKKSTCLSVLPSGKMENIGGLEILKAWLRRKAWQFTEAARGLRVDLPLGMSMIGPPGTGKTLTAQAAGDILNLPIIKVDIGALFGGIVGQTEEQVRSMLALLDAMAPCIAFVDEVDKGLGGAHQAGGDSGVSKRVLGYLLTAMSDNNKGIFWIFTANRIEGLDSALLRKGRVDEVFAVLPPNKVERLAILKIHLTKRGHDAKKVKGLEDAVRASKGFVAAEIESAVKEAHATAAQDGLTLTGAMISTELSRIKPISIAFKADFDAMTKWAEENARLASERDMEEIPPARVPRARPGSQSAGVTVDLS